MMMVLFTFLSILTGTYWLLAVIKILVFFFFLGQGEVQDKELGGLLHDKNRDVTNYLGEDFTRYLRAKFVDASGINLRNKVSHGLMGSIGEFDCNIILINPHSNNSHKKVI
jgi:hypothetical protein